MESVPVTRFDGENPEGGRWQGAATTDYLEGNSRSGNAASGRHTGFAARMGLRGQAPQQRDPMKKIAALLLTLILTSLSLALSLVVSFTLYTAYVDYRYGGPAFASVLPTEGKTVFSNLRIYNATPEERRELIRSFERIDFPLHSLSVKAVVVEGLKGADGMFDPITGKIYLQRGTDIGGTLAHEIGHVVEVSRLNRPLRNAYENLRDLPKNAEWGGVYRKGSEWQSKASEDFAEVFSFLFSPQPPGAVVATRYGSIANPQELRLFYLSLVD